MKCWYRICIYCYDMYLQLQNWVSSVFHVSLSSRQACVHNLNTNETWKSNLHLLLQHVLTIAKLNEAKCFTSLSAPDKRVSTIWTHMKCWYRISIYCYDMYLQLQIWIRRSISRLSQLPTDACPQYQHKWNVDIESAFTATTCTCNCRIEWS